LLAEDGWKVNHKRVYRLYRLEGLTVRRRRQRLMRGMSKPASMPRRWHERWSMDFVSDSISGGRKHSNAVPVTSSPSPWGFHRR